MLPVESPFKTYTGLDGRPLNNGFVYFGMPNQNPITAPVNVYLDAAGTIPAAQPLRTVNGYLAAVAGGAPVNVFVADSYSEVVQDSKKRQVFYARNSDDFSITKLIRDISGSQADLQKNLEVLVEKFYVSGEADDGPMLQRAIDFGIANSKSIRGNGLYRSAQGLVIRTYRLEPAVNQDFATFNLYLNQLTYTANTGRAISTASSTARVEVKKLIGPGGTNSADGLYVTGQGDSNHRVDWVAGFNNNVNLDDAFSHTVWVGYCNNATTGVRIKGNAIKLIAGRIGGQFTDGDTALDPTSCDVGVDIISGAANIINSNIEYCRRTTASGCLRDAGEATTFTGYLEGGNDFNLRAFGRGGTYNLVSGNNKLTSPAGIFIENDNKVNFLSQQVQDQIAPTGSNSTLAFETPSLFCSFGFAEISGPQGYRERCIPTSPVSDSVNQILYSNILNGASWTLSTIGAANWGAVTINANAPAYPEAGYPVGTRFVFPASTGNADLFVIGQTGRTLRPGLVNYGMLIKVASGDVDIQVRVLNTDTSRQSKHIVRLRASNKWVNVAARINELTASTTNAQFDIQFRTYTGATVDIANTFLVNEPVSYFPPSNPSPTLRKNLKGIPLDGNTLENGMTVNGIVRNQISPAIASASQYLLGDYPVMLVTGGWGGNMFLQSSPYGDGHRMVVIRDGVAATGGVMQILPDSTTINGSSAAISIAAPYSTVELIWSATANGWLRLS